MCQEALRVSSLPGLEHCNFQSCEGIGWDLKARGCSNI